jgi:hypothetical protein
MSGAGRALPIVDEAEQLPAPFAAWLGELLSGPIPREKKAECSACPMCVGLVEGQGEPIFDPTVKCCSYLPALSNFTVGMILADTDESETYGRKSIRGRIDLGVSVTPLGLGRAPSIQLIGSDNSTFGRSAALLCPHYIGSSGGRCGIWKYRNSVCTTWFCKHVRGATGQTFWRETRELLFTLEKDLSIWSALELGCNPEVITSLLSLGSAKPESRLASELVPSERASEARRVWGTWIDRKVEFFIRAAALVTNLTWKEVLALTGQSARVRALRVLDCYAGLFAKEIPHRLVAVSTSTRYVTGDSARVVTYSPLDALAVSSEVLQLLHYFDGRPTSDARHEIAVHEAIELDDDLLRALVDYRLLVPIGSRQPGSITSS